ncbi:MAG: hypothetical protein AABZ74_06895 [Cyanobacteriota bacterium]
MLYEDIFDDSKKVKINYPYFYVIVLKGNEHDVIPNFVFSDFKKFYDTYDYFSFDKKVEKFGRIQTKGNTFSARLPLLKRFLNRQEESLIEYNKYFEEEHVKITEFMEDSKIKEIEYEMFFRLGN